MSIYRTFLTLFLGFGLLSLATSTYAAGGMGMGMGGDPPSAGITYSVELMGRVFDFAPVTVKDDGALLAEPAEALTFTRPGGGGACSGVADGFKAACDAWDAVFAACENFFGLNPVPGVGPTPMEVSGFTSPAGDWAIDKAGGVRLFMSIPFDSMGDSPPGSGGGTSGTYFSVQLQLIGDTFFDSPHASWLPTETGPENAIDYPIIEFWITGGTAKGIRPKKGCVSGGTAEQTDFDPNQERTLRIEASAVPE